MIGRLYEALRRRRPVAPADVGLAPGHEGHRLPGEERIYAIGDVHGRADLLRAKFAAIDQHLLDNPVRWTRIVMLGDYIDRGHASRETIALILQRAEGGGLVALAGNHEALLLEFLSDPTNYMRWAEVGGAETLMAYGVPPPQALNAERLEELAQALIAAMPAAHLRFLKTLRLAFFHGAFLFVHAGVRPGIPLAEQVLADLLWIREPFLSHDGDLGAVVVHGHTRVLQPEVRENRINIDTGAYVTSRLTCLVLDQTGLSFL